jgi:hypothetical protein
MHLRNRNASRNAGFVVTVSDLALIILAAPEESLAHEGMRPQRTSDNRRAGSFGSRIPGRFRPSFQVWKQLWKWRRG